MSSIIPLKNIYVNDFSYNIILCISFRDSTTDTIYRNLMKGTRMNRITELRKEKNLNQIGLAMKLNVSQKMISAYETGKNEPSIDLLINMSNIFHTSIDYLVENSDIRHCPHDHALTCDCETDSRIISLFNQLSNKNKLIAEGMLTGLVASQRN